MKNYGTMENTMVLWTKLWYYTENYGTSFYEEKNMVDYQKATNSRSYNLNNLQTRDKTYAVDARNMLCI